MFEGTHKESDKLKLVTFPFQVFSLKHHLVISMNYFNGPVRIVYPEADKNLVIYHLGFQDSEITPFWSSYHITDIIT